MKFVAVTSCPTGIAHTYMAAEALERAARAAGHDISVETQGSSGVDMLSPEVIAEADAVIFAADAGVRERERFSGKPTVEVAVGHAINKAAEVIGDAERAAADAPAAAAADADREPGGATAPAEPRPATSTKGGVVRQWLMTGVSYMIPFVTAGGILIALAFLFGDTLTVTEANVYEEFSFPALLMEIGGTAFSMIGPILAGFIAYAMADRPGIVPGIVGGLIATSAEVGAGFLGALIAGLLAGATILLLRRIPFPASLRSLLPVLFYPLVSTFVVGALMIVVIGEPIAAVTRGLTSWLEGLSGANAVLLGVLLGAMMAFDMGGPVNKVAYTFGVGLIASDLTAPMAAVMAAGMTPPLGLALASAVRGGLFDEAEREAGKAAWVMGASFITEGAIPFAAADPLRVIPALIAGSAVAGGVSMAFDVTLPAPHGGIFVIGLVSNILAYLLAIAAGTVVTAVIVIALKSLNRTADADASTTQEPAHA